MLRRVPVPTDRRGIQLVASREGLEAVARAENALTKRMLQLVAPEMAARVSELVQSVVDALDREGDELLERH